MTCAPASASRDEQNGAATACSTAMTVSPSSGSICIPVIQAVIAGLDPTRFTHLPAVLLMAAQHYPHPEERPLGRVSKDRPQAPRGPSFETPRKRAAPQD